MSIYEHFDDIWAYVCPYMLTSACGANAGSLDEIGRSGYSFLLVRKILL